MQAEIPAFDRFWANGDLVRFTLSGFEFRAWDSALPDDRTERSDPEFGMHWNRNRDGSFAFLELHHRMTPPSPHLQESMPPHYPEHLFSG